MKNQNETKKTTTQKGKFAKAKNNLLLGVSILCFLTAAGVYGRGVVKSHKSNKSFAKDIEKMIENGEHFTIDRSCGTGKDLDSDTDMKEILEFVAKQKKVSTAFLEAGRDMVRF